MIRILPPLLLLACETVSTVAPDEPAADPVLVEQALDAVRPGPLLALTDRITALGAIETTPPSPGVPRGSTGLMQASINMKRAGYGKTHAPGRGPPGRRLLAL